VEGGWDGRAGTELPGVFEGKAPSGDGASKLEKKRAGPSRVRQSGLERGSSLFPAAGQSKAQQATTDKSVASRFWNIFIGGDTGVDAEKALLIVALNCEECRGSGGRITLIVPVDGDVSNCGVRYFDSSIGEIDGGSVGDVFPDQELEGSGVVRGIIGEVEGKGPQLLYAINRGSHIEDSRGVGRKILSEGHFGEETTGTVRGANVETFEGVDAICE